MGHDSPQYGGFLCLSSVLLRHINLEVSNVEMMWKQHISRGSYGGFSLMGARFVSQEKLEEEWISPK